MGRGLLPDYRVRDSRGVGCVDYNKTHTKVLMPGTRGYVRVMVRITKGDYMRGQGIVEDKSASSVAFGTQIEFAGGSESGVLPKFVKRLHKAKADKQLLAGVAENLTRSMQMKPSTVDRRPKNADKYVPGRVLEWLRAK